MQRESGRARLGDQFGIDLKIDFLESLLAQYAFQADSVRWLVVDAEHDSACGQIGRAPMQGQEFSPIFARVADPFESATRHQFVETLQPAQATAAFQIDESGIDHLADRRVPAEAQRTGLSAQNVHAAGGHHG